MVLVVALLILSEERRSQGGPLRGVAIGDSEKFFAYGSGSAGSFSYVSTYGSAADVLVSSRT